MTEIEFNLLDESWIRVRLPDNAVREVSLTDALLHAHEYVDLAGETATQDAAVLRLLLSIPLTIFYRVDTEGNAAPLTSSDAALLRWKSLWEQGHFPEKPIRDYLSQWHERFWLFHPERPFWQVPELIGGKLSQYSSAKLNGELSKSGHKDRIFLPRAGEFVDKLSYAETARWLIYIQNWDDAAVKPGTGVGWLGKLGFIQVVGKNIFETMMLNMTMLKDGQELWDTCTPQWERTGPPGLGTKDALAEGFIDVLTQPSRSLAFKRNGNLVTGFSCNGGYTFKTSNNFSEQMTLWKQKEDKKNKLVYYEPIRHDPSKQLWREFPSMIDGNNDAHSPGIVRWVAQLQRLRILDKTRQIYFRSVGIVYVPPLNSSIKDAFSDILSFQINILEELGKVWRTRITEEISKCETAARYLGELEKDLAVAGGFSYSDKTKGILDKQAEAVQGNFYFAIDDPFRQWLRGIDAEEDDPDDKTAAWQKSCRVIAISMGRKMVRESGSAALLGRWAEITKGKSELWTSAKAYNRFQRKIGSLYPLSKEEEGELDGKTAGD